MSENGEHKASDEARMAEIQRISRAASEPLRDELGIIPRLPPLKFDERGRLIPPTPEEQEARTENARRAREAMRRMPYTDTPENDREFFRNMDANRPEGMKQFEGLY